ncbi:N-acetylmuramoyl-L-alanine amidase [Bacillus pseudomycoides]|uniref:GH25 family lysozyme n=1 Tax=Bacillus pseudomycoides TaxID=64104 RepID=UPI000BEC8776|nr:GH25 family lysozyme [Bacillus pseudomycoides]PDY46423.1 N-acetylmuramoyl-L-alanine amidase [Bacillus pseudomycoides]PED69091.1 N-acetylmuramoyl-L-alanine amidase [Bacillus pseudomycoides]PEI43975.1 N-acetylmuramoyl-L-alanine amidase [Bacillus pseudomycoides]PEJ69931.1 N-acetylmuramoyl-L-alanine amidase [Bacillus pseudomycoides]PEM08575.1 N-acetylmuramoyl-L-alanine amidase [Bacillus pseudomycoides]
MSFGIDVSHHEGRINWNQVKNDPNQVNFMITKVTEGSEQGTNYIDPTFQYNINGANNVGILTGAYHFFRAISVNDAKQEAAFFIKNIQSVTLTAPVFVDVEVNDANLDPDTLTDAVNAFLTELKNAGYTSTGVYSNLYFFQNSLNASRLQNTLLWIARYSTRGPGMDCDIWQYTDTGSVQGINGNVDCNISYVDLDIGNNNNGPSSSYIGIATIAGDNVNLRDQPSTSGNVIGTLYHNESYKVFYEQNGWLNLGGNEFIYYDPSYICYCNYIGIATITGDNVNLRDQPSTSGNVIRTLHHNESYKVYYEQNGWLNLGGNQFIYYDPSYIDYELLSSCSDC